MFLLGVNYMDRLQKIGTIKYYNSSEIKDSRLGLGMEKLDRDAFDPEKVYDKVANLGVKWIRLQSGWQKTEREEGVYNFAWLDSQVDNLLSRGLKPWLCLCYGNTLYDDLAKEYYGTVGCPPIRTEKAYNAWLKYVEATVEHFKGRIEFYEVWNESEGVWTWRPAPSSKEYFEFCKETAYAIKKADSNAKVITGSHYEESVESFNNEFKSGSLEFSDAVTYHCYNFDERYSSQRVKAIRALMNCYGKEIDIIQGESGSQSKSGGGGALYQFRTNQNMQTKQILRHTVADILAGVKFTSVFSCVDMAENLDAKEGKPITICGYFGLLGAEFDFNTGNLIGDYYEKPSYYAFRNLCSIFNENVKVIDIPTIFTPIPSPRLNTNDCPTCNVVSGTVEKKNGSKAFTYWNSTDLVTTTGYEGTVTFELTGVSGEVKLIDTMDGTVYSVPDEIVTKIGENLYRFKNLPIKDYPLVITFGDFCE